MRGLKPAREPLALLLTLAASFVLLRRGHATKQATDLPKDDIEIQKDVSQVYLHRLWLGKASVSTSLFERFKLPFESLERPAELTATHVYSS